MGCHEIQVTTPTVLGLLVAGRTRQMPLAKAELKILVQPTKKRLLELGE
jgi:hypothetical protein